MAVAENGVASGGNHYDSTDLDRSNDNHINNNEKTEKCSLKSQSLPKNDAVVVSEEKEDDYNSNNNNNNNNLENNHSGLTNSGSSENSGVTDDDDFDDDHQNIKFDDNNNNDNDKNENGKNFDEKEEEGFKKEIRDLQEMLSKLNPMAKEFVPPSLVNYVNINNNMFSNNNGNFGYVNNFLIAPLSPVAGNVNGFSGRRRRNGYGNGKRRMNTRTSMAQREDVIRRTLYVSDIDQQVTEEQLAALFINCGPVVDCRICGDPNSVLRFAFVEFMDEEGANAALSLSGTMLGYYPVRVLPSKTAIAPVNPTFLPKSEGEREMCARTVYCTNIDKKVTQSEVKLFFESFCGEVQRLRLLGDYHHSTRIAFVEFAMAESAISALNCSGAVLGSLPIRVSPSKTPVRPRPPRSPLH
ncbi:polyadenylate-binding protein-interacting protein 11-like [Chenopodium quinoa]|uniref:polyadenylate-binding protein-interacting protein 11-like n=1 Tax=Chenopodium quinoa TaxID=63459 RepID=UPI000B77FDA0|nr:polyadenylate-binding protein-interacting protein 11-like [Chenopodium quinoa]XP_021763198.1 polyadenylate-binding protein-interacting protein 11-like [Chenopodium quinoa]